MSLDQARVIVLNGGQTMALMSCLFLPFFCALVAWLLLGEALTPRLLIGCGLVVAGLVVASRK